MHKSRFLIQGAAFAIYAVSGPKTSIVGIGYIRFIL